MDWSLQRHSQLPGSENFLGGGGHPSAFLAPSPVQAAVDIDSLINVQYAAIYTCLACRHARPSSSAIFVESIPIPAPSGNTATRTLKPEVQLALGDETREVKCPSCGKSGRTRATFQLAGMPPLLCFEVNRHSAKSNAKRDFLLRAPAEFASVFQNVECKFRLLATICHIGKSVSSGHFVWCTQGSDGWFRLDPGSSAKYPSLSTIAERDVLSSTDVTPLFYERTSVTRLHSPHPSTASSCSSSTVTDYPNDFQSPAKQFLKDCDNTPLPIDPECSTPVNTHTSGNGMSCNAPDKALVGDPNRKASLRDGSSVALTTQDIELDRELSLQFADALRARSKNIKGGMDEDGESDSPHPKVHRSHFSNRHRATHHATPNR